MATDIKQLFPEKSVTLVHSRANVMSKFHSALHSIVQQRFDDLGVETVLGRGRVKLPQGGYPTDGSEFNVELQDGTKVINYIDRSDTTIRNAGHHRSRVHR